MRRRDFLLGAAAMALPTGALMAGVPSGAYYSGGDAPQSSDYYSLTVPAPAAASIPVVDGYAPTWCTGCKLAVKESSALEGIVEFRWHYDSKEFPPEILDLVARGGVYPVLYWKTPNGPRQISNGWKGVHDFSVRFDKTMAPAAPKKQVVAQAQVPTTRRGYPIRGGWWSGCGGWQHLTHGEHAGKFDHNWLASLSNAEVQSLHSDDHEHRVHWDYVVRPGQSVAHYQAPVRRARRG